MHKKYFCSSLLMAAITALMFGCIAGSADAAERSLVGIRIYSNVKVVLLRLGNPEYVLTSGQTVPGAGTSTSTTGPSGGVSPLPPLQPEGAGPSITFNPGGNQQGVNIPLGSGPVSAFGMGGDDAGTPPTQQTQTQQLDNGEVTLVFQKNDVTYEVLLSPSGSVIQITALGYSDPATRTEKGVTFGSSYPTVIAKYGYPENQTETNQVVILDYSHSAHCAFELVNDKVVGIVVAAVD
jgi:hypothetical protein